jgi:hypothetical protein
MIANLNEHDSWTPQDGVTRWQHSCGILLNRRSKTQWLKVAN